MTGVTPTSGEAIEAEFPQWHAWKGVNGLWYAAVKRSSPQILVKGVDLVDLRDSIIKWTREH